MHALFCTFFPVFGTAKIDIGQDLTELQSTIYCYVLRKYVDDTTLSEVLESKTQDSYMLAFIENLLDWADRNDMQVNTAKPRR